MRRQFGLKLRAQDACNLVYAMWRIEPESKLVVSVKSNPGENSSAQCGNRGYQNIKPRRSSPVPTLEPGATHTLHAVMNGAEMQVFADNSLVWDGFGWAGCNALRRTGRHSFRQRAFVDRAFRANGTAACYFNRLQRGRIRIGTIRQRLAPPRHLPNQLGEGVNYEAFSSFGDFGYGSCPVKLHSCNLRSVCPARASATGIR
jgi:hypothetical protein